MTTLVEYADSPDIHILRLSGDIRYGDVMSLQQLVDRLDGTGKPYLIDLTFAQHLDSTALGVLAMTAKQSKEYQLSKPKIYASCSTVMETLRGVCFDLVFDLYETNPPTIDENGQYQLILPEALKNSNIKDIVVEAHKVLAEISEKNKELFKDVNDILNSAE